MCYRVRRHITTEVLLHVLDVARSSTILSTLFTSYIRLFASHNLSRCFRVEHRKKRMHCCLKIRMEFTSMKIPVEFVGVESKQFVRD